MTIKENEPMSKHLTFRIGGPARYFVEIKTVEELQQAIDMAKEKSLPWFVLGGGSNTLCSDKGYDGVVIQMANREVTIVDNKLTAGAGAISVAVARAAGDASLSGIEWMVSLPGMIGGAVRGNAGCFGGEMKDVVATVTVFSPPARGGAGGGGSIHILNNSDCHFAYRESIFKTNHDVIIDVTLKLIPGDKETIKAKMNEVLGKRKATQPTASGTAGCAFKNPLVDGKLLSCGKLIDELGLKGTKIGGISVSDVHGNFLINDGTATADQVIQLLSLIKMKARDERGVELTEEIQYLGF